MSAILSILPYLASVVQGLALGVFILSFTILRFKDYKKEYNLLGLSSLVLVVVLGFVSA